MKYHVRCLGLTTALLWLAGDQCCLPGADRPEPPLPTRAPLVRVIDLNVGESQVIELSSGARATVKLLDLHETRDSIRSAVRSAQVRVEVDGKPITLSSGNYHLPQRVAGVRIDCPITKGYRENSTAEVWGLDKAARLRLWPADSPLLRPGTFVYPARQRWFASATQMANEPVYVDGGEDPAVRKIYYHYGLDIGGAEALVDVIAATEGLVVSSGKAILPGYEKTPARPRYDVVYLLDDQGWYYRYSHLNTIDAAIKPGAKVTKGQKLGLLGKEGGSGGWSHLHFDITSKQPSGKWGIQEGYAFLWEAYQNEHRPRIQAVARPHHFAWAGQPVTLDGSRSWAADKIARFEWTCTDGQTATGATLTRTYDKPGTYSEILKVADTQGRIDYDFAIVQILDKEHPDRLPPSIHAAYAPTLGIKPGDAITFKVRSFRTPEGGETWDFGDGSPPVQVRSDGNAVKLARDGYAVTTHRYAKAGHYLVRVEHRGRYGVAVARLHVRVGEE
jgi:murein DD-endopeptidase MepM/ murein hydrolase activator NlpD